MPHIDLSEELVIELAGGEIQGAVAETLPSRDSQNNTFLRRIQVRPGYFSEFLGVSLKTEQVEKTLCAHECVIEKTTSDEWTVVPPSYRLDLALKEDLAEEVARSIGYDKIPATIPRLTTPPAPLLGNSGVEGLAKINKAKDSLVRSGLLETINFAFTSDAWLRQFGMSATARVMNPLSEEHEALAPSLLPGLVRNALDNWRHHFGSESLAIRLFELRPTFQVRDSTIGIAASGEMDTGVEERWRLALVLSGPRLAGGLRNEQVEVDFYDLKGVIESLFEALGTRGIRFQPLASSRNKDQALIGLFHPGKSVEILAGNQVGGILGLMHPGKSKELKTRAPLWLAELDWEVLSKLSMSAFEPHSFKAWPEFPSMERDFALLVRDEITADKITQTALRAGRPLAKGSKIFDIYRGSQVPEGMTSVAVRVIFFDETRSLQESETEAVSARILEAWKKELGAELRNGEHYGE
jgi:phenylalanyl-tRNA synthetase beta chain